MSQEKQQQCLELQCRLGAIPSIIKGNLTLENKGGTNYNVLGVQFITKIKDYLQKTNHHIINQFLLTEMDGTWNSVTLPTNSIKLPLFDLKPVSTELNIQFHNKDKENQPTLEIYQSDHLKQIIKLKDFHGPFIKGDNFGKPNYSRSNVLVYLTEKKKEKNVYGDEIYEYSQNYGETLTHVNEPVIAVLDLDSVVNDDGFKEIDLKEKLKLINLTNLDEYQPIEVAAHPYNKEKIIVTVYRVLPKKHGLVYCNNRPKMIIEVDISTGEVKNLTDESWSCYGIKVIGEDLLYFKNQLGWAHNHSSLLVKYSLKTHEETILVDQIEQVGKLRDFPGLYAGDISDEPIITIGDNKFLLINSQWNCYRTILAISYDNESVFTSGQSYHRVHLLSEDINSTQFSYKLLDHRYPFLLASRSSPNTPSELVLGTIKVDIDQINVKWDSIYNNFGIKEIESIKYKTLNLRKDIESPLEIIHIQAPNVKDSDRKLILNLHGGPHGSNIVEYSWLNTHLLLKGYDILHVNYSGSHGYGTQFTNSLIGKVGKLDVGDCHYALKTIHEKQYTSKPIVMGGSHGGFLTAHLIGQYPDLFKQAILRNPVINIGSMAKVSDITDWCFYESGLSYDYKELKGMNPELYGAMYQMSPEQYIPNIRTPLLLLVGLSDQRVPPSQALDYYHLIKAKDSKLVKMLTFDGTGHALDTFHAEMGSILGIFEALEG